MPSAAQHLRTVHTGTAVNQKRQCAHLGLICRFNQHERRGPGYTDQAASSQGALCPSMPWSGDLSLITRIRAKCRLPGGCSVRIYGGVVLEIQDTWSAGFMMSWSKMISPSWQPA